MLGAGATTVNKVDAPPTPPWEEFKQRSDFMHRTGDQHECGPLLTLMEGSQQRKWGSKGVRRCHRSFQILPLAPRTSGRTKSSPSN